MAQPQALGCCADDREPAADTRYLVTLQTSLSNSQTSLASTSQPIEHVENPSMSGPTLTSPSVASPLALTVAPSGGAAVVPDSKTSLHQDKALLLKLPIEILQKMFKTFPDMEAVAATAASCQYLMLIYQGHEHGILKALVERELGGELSQLHDGAIAAVKIAPNNTPALRDINNFLEFIWVSRGVGRRPDPRPTTIADIKRLMFPASPQETTETQSTKSGVDVVEDPLTLRGALELYRVLTAHRELMALFLDHEQQTFQPADGTALRQGFGGGPMGERRAASALWEFERFCRVFGGDEWWVQRWRHSLHFPHIIAACWMEWPSRNTHDLVRVHDFLRSLMRPLWEAVTRGTSCMCRQQQQQHQHQQQQQPQGPDDGSWCDRCRDRGLRGTLAGGLAAIAAIHRAKGTEELKDCFVWHDGRPREHHFFLRQFYFARTGESDT